MSASLQKAALGALGVEILLFLLITFVWAKQMQHPVPQNVVQMVLIPTPAMVKNPAPIVNAPHPKPLPVPPKQKLVSHRMHVMPIPKPVLHPLPKMMPHPRPKTIPRPIPNPIHHLIHRPEPNPVVKHHSYPENHEVVKTMVKPVVKSVTPPVPSVTPKYRDMVRAAVQRSVIYPLAAKIAQITGKVRVSFVFSDGQVSDEKVLVGSGARVLDQAALAAILRAHIPAPPVNLQDQVLHFEIWVRFYMVHS